MQAEHLAQQHGCADSISMLANAVRSGYECSEVELNVEVCLAGQPILDDNGQPITAANGQTTYQSNWLKLVDRKDGITLLLSEEAKEYIQNINLEVDKDAIRDARKAQRETNAKAKRESLLRRQRYAEDNGVTTSGTGTSTVPPTGNAGDLFGNNQPPAGNNP
jgi:hypothetical protein